MQTNRLSIADAIASLCDLARTVLTSIDEEANFDPWDIDEYNHIIACINVLQPERADEYMPKEHIL